MSLERGTSGRLSLKNFSRKLSLRNKDYSKVEDLYDTRVPLHNEDAFSHGLKFKAKFIGSLEISRPTCKVDIITAMRRIRYEYKVKGVRKVRSTLEISTQGVRVTKRKRKRSHKYYSEEQLFIMQHPIYRIFYVSHDSQDMKIFSYITRELPDSTFRCNVFKAYKKNMALHIVRSLGQAFDVCHRLNPRPKKAKKEDGEESGEKDNGEEGEVKNGEGEEQKETDEANISVELGTELGRDAKPQQQKDVHKDLMDLDFDPFNSSFGAPVQAATLPNGAPQMAFESNFTTGEGGGGRGGGPGGALPPFLVSKNSTSGLPDLPEGSGGLPPAGRPRPRPSTTHQQQNIIQENPFTDTLNTGSESPSLSITEAIDGQEKMLSNPFLAESLLSGRGGQPPSMWELHKQQMMAQMALMQEQLKQETAARIESQARVEHLLLQNKQLLTHVQKLMVELEKLQSLQMAQLVASGIQPPDIAASAKPAASTSSSTATAAPSLPAIPESSVETTMPLLPPSEKPVVPPSEPVIPPPLSTQRVVAPLTVNSPTHTPPPDPEPVQQLPTENEPFSVEPVSISPKIMAESVATNGSSTSTTTVSTDSEQLGLDVPTPLTQLGEPGTSAPRSSTPLSAASDPIELAADTAADSRSSEFPIPLPDVTDLPMNDPFTPQ